MSGLSSHIFQIVSAGLFLAGNSFLCSCSSKPKDVIPEKEMVQLMADMQLAEAYADAEYRGAESFDRREELAKSVLARHGVSEEELDSTLSWYGRNLDTYSELFEKVDKELAGRKEKLLKTEGKGEKVAGDNLWPYSQNGLLSNLGNSDAFVFSISDPELQKGDIIEWDMHISKAAYLTGVLGVDYNDGEGEAVSSVFSGRLSLDLRLQTDTGKTVRRIYGTMRLKDRENMPLFADSISLQRLPFDSVEFAKYRNQKRYGVPSRIIPVNKERKDSTENDSVGMKEKPAPGNRVINNTGGLQFRKHDED